MVNLMTGDVEVLGVYSNPNRALMAYKFLHLHLNSEKFRRT